MLRAEPGVIIVSITSEVIARSGRSSDGARANANKEGIGDNDSA